MIWTTWILKRRKKGHCLNTRHLPGGRKVPDRLTPKVSFILKAGLPKRRWVIYNRYSVSYSKTYKKQQVLPVNQTLAVAQLEKWQALHNTRSWKMTLSVLLRKLLSWLDIFTEAWPSCNLAAGKHLAGKSQKYWKEQNK